MLITTGTIKGIPTSTSTNYRVQVSLFRNAGTRQQFQVDAWACNPAGLYNNYKNDDLVYIGFIENDADAALILGLVQSDLDAMQKRNTGALNIQSLTVDGKALQAYIDARIDAKINQRFGTSSILGNTWPTTN